MNEGIQMNWLLLIGPFLWILGTAVILALLGFMEFLKTSGQVKRSDFLKKPLFKKGVRVSAILIIAGLLLYLCKLPSNRFIVVKIETQGTGIRLEDAAEPLHFSPKELEMDGHNKNHPMNNEKMKDNTMMLFWDGYVHTPFITFKKGDYFVGFQAKGSRAKDEYAKLKVELESLDKNFYVTGKTVKYIELTDEITPYRMPLKIESDTVGRIRVTYFNDLHVPEDKQGRDVWLKSLIVRKMGKI